MPHTPELYLDTETTRLRRPYLPQGRRVWEIGANRVDVGGDEHSMQAFVRVEDLGLQWMLPPDVHDAIEAGDLDGSPTGDWYQYLPDDVQESLAIGDFLRRHPQVAGVDTGVPVLSEKEAAHAFALGPWLRSEIVGGETHTPTIIGVVPSFDDLGMHDMLYRHGLLGPDDEAWYYHFWDAETFAAGALGMRPRVSSDAVTQALCVDVSDLTRHRAFDDAIWARRMYEAALRLRRGK